MTLGGATGLIADGSLNFVEVQWKRATMSTALRLSIHEYDRMVASGAFTAIDRRVELIRVEATEMTPAGSMHDEIVAYLLDQSFQMFDAKTA